MFLRALVTADYPSKEREWEVKGLTLGNTNLLVGKNATGKTRTLNVISNLAKFLCGVTKEVFDHGHHEMLFESDPPHKKLEYRLSYEHSSINNEEFILDDEKLLHRGAGDPGKIKSVEFNGMMKFKTSSKQAAVLSKRDSEQHPFLEPLINWALSVRHFEFSKGLGQHRFAIPMKGVSTQEVDDRDTNNLIPILNHGLKNYKEEFKKVVIEDMGALGYLLEDVFISKIDGMVVLGPGLEDIHGVTLQERDLRCTTTHGSISQGMFRALSILIQLNYAVLSNKPACFLIDDIGEGLDFERSCALIELVREKAIKGRIQLIMSTNDRFVMNAVPLEEWILLRRHGHTVQAYTYRDHQKLFDRFRITGMNNFDFLASDFLEKMLPHEQNGHLR